ncbi:MAG: hypothetical protein PHS84_12010 [Paludibacter sp.]|jgi:hypothetical protein|nr:hypothetical protein [Paludibacter sp.]
MIEYLKLVASCLTPLTIILIGIIINRRLEKSKIEFLKEKEWQIIWADRFLNSANELNDNISFLICTLFELQGVQNGTNEYREKIILMMKYRKSIQVNEWNIKNYTQFSENNGQYVVNTLKDILDGLTNIIDNRQGDIEPIRQKQFEFNKVVRNAHAEILKINTVDNIMNK